MSAGIGTCRCTGVRTGSGTCTISGMCMYSGTCMGSGHVHGDWLCVWAVAMHECRLRPRVWGLALGVGPGHEWAGALARPSFFLCFCGVSSKHLSQADGWDLDDLAATLHVAMLRCVGGAVWFSAQKVRGLWWWCIALRDRVFFVCDRGGKWGGGTRGGPARVLQSRSACRGRRVPLGFCGRWRAGSSTTKPPLCSIPHRRPPSYFTLADCGAEAGGEHVRHGPSQPGGFGGGPWP